MSYRNRSSKGVSERLRHDSEGVDSDRPIPMRWQRHLAAAQGRRNARQSQSTRREAILGEGEAAKRLDAILALLARPDVNYISVKLSAIFSQINLLAWTQTVEQLKERMRGNCIAPRCRAASSSIWTWKNTATWR